MYVENYSSRGPVLIYYSGGLSLDEQILEDGAIPMTETDARLNVLVTAQGTLS